MSTIAAASLPVMTYPTPSNTNLELLGRIRFQILNWKRYFLITSSVTDPFRIWALLSSAFQMHYFLLSLVRSARVQGKGTSHSHRKQGWELRSCLRVQRRSWGLWMKKQNYPGPTGITKAWTLLICRTSIFLRQYSRCFREQIWPKRSIKNG